MIVAIDFDGTVVSHKYPEMGETIEGAVDVLKLLVKSGRKIILYTMRDGKELEDAVNWYKENKIPLYGINNNPDQDWTTSPKIYANLYIDDLALGCPLKYTKGYGHHVDWKKVKEILIEQGFVLS